MTDIIDKFYKRYFVTPEELFYATESLNKKELKNLISSCGKRIPEDCCTVTLDVVLTTLLSSMKRTQEGFTIIQEANLDILFIKDEEHTKNQYYIPVTNEAEAKMQIFLNELARREKEHSEWMKNANHIRELEKYKGNMPYPHNPNDGPAFPLNAK